jgi:hypothetical protein
MHTGTISAVGADHVELIRDGKSRIVQLCHVVSVELDR